MDIGAHQFTEGAIDPAVAGQARQAVKNVGNDSDPKMPSTVPRPRMAYMKVGFVDHFELVWAESRFQAGFNEFDALGSHGSTRLKGRTSARVQAPTCR